MNVSHEDLELLPLIQPDRDAFIAEQGVEAALVYDGVLEALENLHKKRKAEVVDFKTYNLPQLPEQDRDEIYERIVKAEKAFFSRNLRESDYDRGTALYDNEVLWTKGDGVIVTTEHATHHQRTDDGTTSKKTADYGTGGVGVVVHQDTQAVFIAPLGRQTGDENHDRTPGRIKQLLEAEINSGIRSHISLHGMGHSLVESLTDERPFHVMLGVGPNPSDETMATVDIMQEVASKYDLRLGVNQLFIPFKSTGAHSHPKRKEDGTIVQKSFSATAEGTTRSFSQSVGERSLSPFSAVQVELSNVLRLLPEDYRLNPGIESQRTGVYLGYLFLRECVELAKL